MRALERVTAQMAYPMGGGSRGKHADAQDLVYDAWEVDSPDRELLAQKALEIDPDCADAYTILAEAAETAEDALALFRRGVEAAERVLGPKPFTEDVGHFWLAFETRPFMRARAGLAETLWLTGDRDEALEHLMDMLRLNPNDNQGIRYVAAPRLIERGRLDEAEALLAREEYADDGSAEFAYARALLAYAREGAGDRAELFLRRAIAVNPLVPEYLSGLLAIDYLPSSYRIGDDDEAVILASEQLAAWEATSGAVEWLREIADVPAPPPPPADLDERIAWLFPDLPGDLSPANLDDLATLIAGDHPDLLQAFERDERVIIDGEEVSPGLHLATHEMVAQQVMSGAFPLAWETARRLQASGYPQHEVLHMIGAALSEQIFEIMHNDAEFDEADYEEALRTLPGWWEDLKR